MHKYSDSDTGIFLGMVNRLYLKLKISQQVNYSALK